LSLHAISTLQNFSAVTNALNSFDNVSGLKTIVKCLALVEFTDHPKDIAFLSEFFAEFFQQYQNSQLFPQTFNLPNTVSSQDSAVIFFLR
jgi:hypothetical protein